MSRGRATLVLYVGTLAPALFVGAPIAALATSSFGAFPDGEKVLLRPGGDYLAELVRLSFAPLHAAAALAVPALVALAVFGLFPLGIAIAEVAPADESGAAAWVRGVRAAPMLALVFVLSLGLRAVVIAVVGIITVPIAGTLTKGASPATQDVAIGVAFAVIALAVALVRVVQDLASVAAVRERAGLGPSLLAAFAAFRDRPFACVRGYAARAVPMVVVVVLAQAIATHVGLATQARAAFVAALHQAAIVAVVALRASWLRAATSVVSTTLK